MYSDDDLLPLSALQHLLFCPRQCALIHVEQVWADNRLTVEGQHLHRKAHETPDERRGRVRMVRGLALRSLQLGLIGKADVVEFEPVASGQCSVAREEGLGGLFRTVREAPAEWRVTPVEYKRGRPKKHDADRVQLCAQAICLEEMLSVRIDLGMLFYGRRRRRTEVALDVALRATTEAAAQQLHALIASGRTPPARREAKCKTCSLADLCLPGITGGRSAAGFVDRQLTGHLASPAPESDLFDREEGMT